MSHPKMQYTYVGIDSHKGSHTAVFLDCFYEKLGEITLSSIPSEFDGFLKEAKKYKLPKTKFAFGFEDVSAYGRSLVKFLIGKNQLVKHVNASRVANERNSQNILQKTDAIDAECTARILLNRFDQLPNANPHDSYWILSNLVTRRRSIVKINVMLKNHLHSLLPDHYPSYRNFFTDISCSSATAFYGTYPSPSLLIDVSVDELSTLLKGVSKGKVGEAKAIQILNAVQNDGVQTLEHQSFRDFTIQSTVRQLKSNKQEIKTIDKQLEMFLDHFGYQLTSMKGIDAVTAGRLISEIGDIERFPTSASLARYAGVAPVTYASGMTNLQFANLRGNRRLNETFFKLAVGMIRTVNDKALNSFFYEYYQKKIAEGKTKRQALKCIERRLVNIIWRMMKHKQSYINPPPKPLPKTDEAS